MTNREGVRFDPGIMIAITVAVNPHKLCKYVRIHLNNLGISSCEIDLASELFLFENGQRQRCTRFETCIASSRESTLRRDLSAVREV